MEEIKINKVINIFLGSSVDKREFEIEREKLGSFIQSLNNYFLSKGVHIRLYDCENTSNAMRIEGSQKQHDDFIKDKADAAFFMFYRKAGEFTLHELQIARDTFVAHNHPNIFTYFKIVGDDIEQTDEIKNAVNLIVNSYGQHYCKFSNVDTIKLGMLQYIVDKLNDGSKITINDSKVCLDNIEVISVDNIFAFQNNAEYQSLKQKISELENKISYAISNSLLSELDELTNELTEKEKLLANLGNDILNMLFRMQRDMKKENIDSKR